MSSRQYFELGQNVTMLNRACEEERRKQIWDNKKLIEAKDELFFLRYEMYDNRSNYEKHCLTLCKAHDLFENVVGKRLF
jgi:hypothetical protein